MDSHSHRLLLLALCVILQACAKDTLTQTPTTIRVLTEKPLATGSVTDGAPPAAGRLSSDVTLLEPVVRVSSRLVAAARRSEFGSRARDLCWSIAVFEDDTPSRTFVRPDGTIVVSSASFHFAQTEAGLAALLSHELIHALANDAAPVPPPCRNTAGAQPPSLFTHQEELQADEKGLRLLAEAGYDPRELLWLWERMKRENDGIGDGVLVHLTYDRRMERIARGLQDALTRYERTKRAPQKALPSK
jgi:metalloendopeptidase OMA1, mitochondrial